MNWRSPLGLLFCFLAGTGAGVWIVVILAELFFS